MQSKTLQIISLWLLLTLLLSPFYDCGECNEEITYNVDTTYKTNTVIDEYIILFNGYYIPQARIKYVKALFRRANVLNIC